MKVYRVNFYDPGEGCIVSWHSNKADARADLLSKQRDRRGESQGVEEVVQVEVPTTRAALVGWLNETIVRDNG